VAFGVVAIFVTWVPLAAAAEAVRQSFLRRWVNPGASASEIADAVAALPESFRYRWWGLTLFLALVPLGLSGFGAGYLVGRWAPKDVAKKAGALAGFAAATMALGAAWVTGGAFAGALVPWGLVMAFVWAGTRVGYRRPRP
jgi:hypothetical protein